jgi:hypothetical protein
MMFEVGRDYKFTIAIGENGEERDYWTAEVLEVSLPLIKLMKVTNGWDSTIIFNTATPSFVRAELLPYRSPEEKEATRKAAAEKREADRKAMEEMRARLSKPLQP